MNFYILQLSMVLQTSSYLSLWLVEFVLIKFSQELCGQILECLYNGSPDEANTHAESFIQQGLAEFGTAQNITGTMWPAYFLLFHNIDHSLGGFDIILPIMGQM